MTRHYFAYGSNMDEDQMAFRCPTGRLIGRATLKGYSFLINNRGVASVIVAPKGIVQGLLWTITDDDEKALDRYEGVGKKHYTKTTVSVESEPVGASIEALAYIGSNNSPGSPRVGYLEKIIDAGRKHGFPPEYIAELESWLPKLPDGEEYDSEEPVNLAWLRGQDLSKLPAHVALQILDNNFPNCTIWREGQRLVIQIEEHIYTKYWWHKFHGSVFADALVRAVRRLREEGHPLSDPELDSQDDDVHIFVRWLLKLPTNLSSEQVIRTIDSSFDLVWRRANLMLEDSDSVLILGKDSGDALRRLKKIEAVLQEKGYYTYIIREQPDRLGESVIQKVLRYALSAKFVVVENSEASGHLYELPHVAKLAECITVILQEEGKGATWMFEDAYFKHHNLKRFSYKNHELGSVVVGSNVGRKVLQRLRSPPEGCAPVVKDKTDHTEQGL